MDACGVPMITPGGGLGAHIDARAVVSHIPSEQYPAGSLVAALYLCGDIRGMERGTLSEDLSLFPIGHISYWKHILPILAKINKYVCVKVG